MELAPESPWVGDGPSGIAVAALARGRAAWARMAKDAGWGHLAGAPSSPTGGGCMANGTAFGECPSRAGARAVLRGDHHPCVVPRHIETSAGREAVSRGARAYPGQDSEAAPCHEVEYRLENAPPRTLWAGAWAG